MRKNRFSCVLNYEPRCCGAAALATVAQQYGLFVSVSALADIVGTDRQGADLASLREAAIQLGFAASWGKIKPGVYDEIPLPAIVHFDDSASGHFVVLHEVTETGMLLADPDKGLIRISRQEFIQRTSGQVLLLRPSPDFVAGGKRDPSPLESMIRLFRYEKGAVGTCLFLAGVTTVVSFAIARLAQVVFDTVIPYGNRSVMMAIGIGLFSAVCVRTITGIGRTYILLQLGRRIETNLGLGYMRRIFAMSLRFFDRWMPGDIYERFGDAANVRNAMVNVALSSLLDLCFLLLYSVFLVVLNHELGALCLITMVPLVLLTILTKNRLLAIEIEAREAKGELARRLIEFMNNMKVIKMFGRESVVYSVVQREYEKSQRCLVKRGLVGELAGSGSRFITGVAITLVLIAGAALVVRHELTEGQLIFFYSSVGLWLSPLERLAPSLTSIQGGIVGIQRIEVLEKWVDNSVPALGFGRTPPESGVLSFRNVGFWHRKGYPVISDCTFDLDKGERLAIVGPTGSGKSTFACLAAGLYSPNKGEILVGLNPHTRCEAASQQSDVTIVFHEPGLMGGTIFENIKFGISDASPDAVHEAAKIAEAHDFIVNLPRGYQYDVGTNGASLSSGQRQRIAIARGLLANPLILILDEATGSLDVETERRLLERVLAKRQGRTTILITHRLGVAAQFSDRILVLEGGRIVESGPHRVLLGRRGRYFSMWAGQAKGSFTAGNEVFGNEGTLSGINSSHPSTS
jgi:ABC-type bacteriocin/lantibiotic exporter with double-glycine peptidase domain